MFLNLRLLLFWTTLACCGPAWSQSSSGDAADSIEGRSTVFLQQLRSLPTTLDRSDVLAILGFDEVNLPSESPVNTCESFEYVVDGWRYFANIMYDYSGIAIIEESFHYLDVDGSPPSITIFEQQPVPCGVPWCLGEPHFAKEGGSYCYPGSYKMGTGKQGQRFLKVGMQREEVYALLGLPVQSAFWESFPYESNGMVMYLRVGFFNNRVTTFGSGYQSLLPTLVL